MRYKIVGWYSANPHNEHVTPFARVVFVDAATPQDAREKGSDALDRLYEEKGESVDFLNWYVEEIKSFQ